MEPKLRFKEFSGEWEEKKLGEIVQIKSGKTPNGLLDLNGTIPFFKVEQLNNSVKYQENTPYYIKKEAENIIKSGSIIFPKRGAAILLNKIRILKQDSFMDTNLMTLTIKNNNYYYNEFIYYKILGDDLSKIADTTSIPQINNKHIEPYKIKIPSLSEQTKIADFLSTVDDKIQNQQDKITHLENIKKGFMQKIFSRKIRFKDDNGNEFPEWEEKKLGEIVEEYSCKTKEQDEYPILSSTKSGIYLQSQYFNKQTASENTLGYKIVPKGYFTYRAMSDTGEFTFNIQNIIDKGIVSPAYPVFKTIRDNSIFLNLFLNNSSFIKKQLLVVKEGSTRYALSFEKFCKLKVLIPCLEEQRKIADFLSSFDEKIDVEKEILEHLEAMKKGLLQQMFV